MTTIFFTCAPAFERILERESGFFSMHAEQSGPGWILANRPAGEFNALFAAQEFCFARRILDQPVEQPVSTLPALSRVMSDFFCQAVRNEKIDKPWPLSIQGLKTNNASIAAINKIEKLFIEHLKKAMARVSKLAFIENNLPTGLHYGLFVVIIDSDRAFISRQCWSGGQQRRRFKKDAPSRSFLKVEEAYAILGKAPQPDETVVDLGAAPGGWSYSAAERGARITAVDNGPLKAGALNHPLIEHRREDAFNYNPSQKPRADWLFCDLVEEPHHVLRLVKRWITTRACRYFIVNLKFGRSDPMQLLSQIYDPQNGLQPYCKLLRVRHLYHDREEITLMGQTKE